MANEISQLLELQSIDQCLTESSEHMKRLQRERERFEAKIVEVNRAFVEQKDAQRKLEHDSLMKNLEVDEMDANIREYQHRLDTGIISFKEMEDLRAKIISEKKRINQLEDEALQTMDAVTAGKEALVSAEETLQARLAEINETIADIDGQLASERDATAQYEANRRDVIGGMSDFLSNQYEMLHRKFADPIVPVSHTTCAGCKLKLSGSTIERARGSIGIVNCEHCSRILYID